VPVLIQRLAVVLDRQAIKVAPEGFGAIALGSEAGLSRRCLPAFSSFRN